MSEKHLIHKNEPVPFSCEDCEHFIGYAKCKAFELIPLEYFADAESHDKAVKGQQGDFIFTTKKKRQFNRVYVIE